jgi:hypothetical protein
MPEPIDTEIARTVERAGIWRLMGRLPTAWKVVFTVGAACYLYWRPRH